MSVWCAVITRCSQVCGLHWAIHLGGSGHMEEFFSILRQVDGDNPRDHLTED